MAWKIVIFIAAFSFTNASVILDKLYEDKPETQVKQALEEDYLSSDQLAQDAMADFLNPDLNAPDSKLFICKDRVCNRLCRILRFERGSCDSCKCKCFKKDAVTDADGRDDAETVIAEYNKAEESDVILNKDEAIEDSSTDIVDSTLDAQDSKFICKDRVCNRLCRILRFERGSCESRKCKCFKKDAVTSIDAGTDAETAIANCAEAEEINEILNEVEEIDELMAVEYTEVEELNMIGNEDEENDTPDPENIINTKSCNCNACNKGCKKRNFDFGVCKNKGCTCYRITPTCNGQSCNQRCRRLGYKYGGCRNKRCFCFRGKDLEESMTDKYTDDEELNIISNEDEEIDTPDLDNIMNTKSCNSNACNQRCRQLGYRYGVCNNKRCFCYRGKDAEDFVADTYDSALEVSDSKLPVCNDRVCDRLCRKLRFDGGSCANGKCKCFKNDTVNVSGFRNTLLYGGSLSGLVYNEAEDSLILNHDEEIELQERACNRYECNINCIRSGNKGGRCWRKQCRCF